MSTFTPETGDGLAAANSYLSIADFEDLSDLLGFDYSAITEEVKESRLIRATMILDAEYRADFPGDREVKGQGLEWPRTGAEYVDGEEIAESSVPREVELATLEMFYILNTGINPQRVISTSGEVSYARDRVEGAVETERRYSSDYGYQRDVYTAVTDALSRITGGMSAYSNLKIIRVGG